MALHCEPEIRYPYPYYKYKKYFAGYRGGVYYNGQFVEMELINT